MIHNIIMYKNDTIKLYMGTFYTLYDEFNVVESKNAVFTVHR